MPYAASNERNTASTIVFARQLKRTDKQHEAYVDKTKRV